MNRAFVHDEGILGGRWRLEGTTVPIALIRTDHARVGRWDTLHQYRFMQLTAAELDAVLAFGFPAVRPETLSITYASVTMHCVCGEDTPETTVGLPVDAVFCICGRVWHLETTHRLAI